jgi:hypothetical protein
MAVTSSFKQQCPSCEALVPIRDPKLVGRKIDCPKCKYRFVVEAPAEEEAAADEADGEETAAAKPKAKAKTAANGQGKKSTAVVKKPAAKTKGKDKPAPDAADDGDEAEEGGKPKKKAAGRKSNTLIIGISLAAVALIALGVGAFFLFGGGEKKTAQSTTSAAPKQPQPGGPGGQPRPGSGGPGAPGGPPNKANTPPGTNPAAGGPANANPAANPTKDKDKAKDEKPPAATASAVDITNLLPNDTQAILSIPVKRLKGTPFRHAIGAPGAFNDHTFVDSFGIQVDDVAHILLGANVQKDWIFTVLSTSRPLDLEVLKRNLRLEETPAVHGLEAFRVSGELDGLSSLLVKANLPRRGLMLHMVDSKTVILADAAPMKQFLENKGRFPNHSTQPEKAPDPKEEKPAAGGPAAPGQPPGGIGGKRMGPPVQGGGAGMVGSGPPTGGPPPGGSAPPAGRSAPPGQPPAGQPPTKKEEPPARQPYSTVSTDLKAVIEEVERADMGEVKALLSTAMETQVFLNPTLQRFLQAEVQSRIGRLSLAPAGPVVQHFRVIGFGLVTLSETKSSEIVVAGIINEDQGPELVKKIHEGLPDMLTSAGLDMAEDTAPVRPTRGGNVTTPGNRGAGAGPGGAPGGAPVGRPGFRGGMGGMGPGMGPGFRPGAGPGAGGPPGGAPGGGSAPPPGMGPGGPPGGGPPGGGRPGGGLVGGGVPPGGFPPGFQPPQGFRGGGNFGQPPAGQPGGQPVGQPGGNPAAPGAAPAASPKGTDGTYAAWSHGNMLIATLNLSLKESHYKALVRGLRDVMVSFRGMAALADTRSHIHDLARATQEYLKKYGKFPRGTLPRPTTADHVLDWPPDERRSWMFEVLPFLGGGEYQNPYDRIDRDRSWYDDANRHLAMFPVPYFLTPPRPGQQYRYRTIYPGKPGVFAGSNWVGVAGVGLDAAYYKPGDTATADKIGIFGYDRETRPEDVKDGLSNTILLLMVGPEEFGPWAAGGGSTVRGISEDADCVRPFVCAEYQGKRGTYAIMADGKVRFILETIPPDVFRALCTMAGNDKVNDLERHAPLVEEGPITAAPPAAKGEPTPPAKPITPAAKGEAPPAKPSPAAKADDKPPPK